MKRNCGENWCKKPWTRCKLKKNNQRQFFQVKDLGFLVHPAYGLVAKNLRPLRQIDLLDKFLRVEMNEARTASFRPVDHVLSPAGTIAGGAVP